MLITLKLWLNTVTKMKMNLLTDMKSMTAQLWLKMNGELKIVQIMVKLTVPIHIHSHIVKVLGIVMLYMMPLLKL